MNAQAIEWSLARQVFSVHPGKPATHYEIVPLGILIGASVPVVHWLLFKHIELIRKAGEMITTPLVLMYLQDMTSGINSTVTSSIILGFSEYSKRREEQGGNKQNFTADERLLTQPADPPSPLDAQQCKSTCVSTNRASFASGATSSQEP